MNRQIYRYRDKYLHTQIDRLHNKKDTQIERYIDRQIDKYKDKQTDIQTHRKKKADSHLKDCHT